MSNAIVSPMEALHSIVLGQRTTPGFITAPRCSDDLAVSVTTARRLLNQLVERGFATTNVEAMTTSNMSESIEVERQLTRRSTFNECLSSTAFPACTNRPPERTNPWLQ